MRAHLTTNPLPLPRNAPARGCARNFLHSPRAVLLHS